MRGMQFFASTIQNLVLREGFLASIHLPKPQRRQVRFLRELPCSAECSRRSTSKCRLVGPSKRSFVHPSATTMGQFWHRKARDFARESCVLRDTEVHSVTSRLTSV